MNKDHIMHVVRTRPLVALAAIALLLVALAPAAAHAEPQLTHGFLRYEVDDNSVVIVDYAGDEEEVRIPAYIEGKPVSRIAKGAFYDSWTVQTIYLPDTVTATDEGAFAEDQEVIFNWNVGSRKSDGDTTQNAANDNGNSSESNTPTNRGTSTTKPTVPTGATSTNLARTSDSTNRLVPALLAGAAVSALCMAAWHSRRQQAGRV